MQSSSDDVRQVGAAFQIVYNLGAMARTNGAGPPHRCPNSPGNVCDSPNDVLANEIRDGATLAGTALDAGHDDYYGHTGSWWDVQDSPFLEHLDSSDHSPPSPVDGLTATSVVGSALFNWNQSTDASTVEYRIYREDGTVFGPFPGTSYTVQSSVGSTITLTIRAEDVLGHFTTPVTIQFKVGYGIVDANGSIVRDTVPPSALGHLKVRHSGKQLVVSWPAATDTVALHGYRVSIGSKVYRVVTGTSIPLPLARAAGRKVTVAALDDAGNLGASAGAKLPKR
jgi:hypothetical protein